jgi:hypothetical protein
MGHDSRTLARPAEAFLLPVLALAGALLAFGVFVWFGGHDPVEVWTAAVRGRLR